MQLRPISKLCFYAIGLMAVSANTFSRAQANGRPPGTTGILAAPSATDEAHRTLLLGATFGLAVSHDGGKHFRWVCEEAIGGPTGVDAILAAPSDKVLVTGSVKGLYVSRDGGCDWQQVDLFAPPKQVSAIATSAAKSSTWYVAINVPEDNCGHIYVTHNGGASFTKLPASHDGAYIYSLATVPKAPERLVAAASNNAGSDSCLLLTSKNGGKTWHKQIVAGAPAASATPSVAVSPVHADVLVVTALDVATNGSTVLLSQDFGQTFRVVGKVQEPVRNIVFTPDGNDVFIATTGHIHRAHVQGGGLEALPSPKTNACAALVGSEMYACGSSANNQDGFALAKSADGGKTMTPIMGLADIQGPQSCPHTSSSYKTCAALWPNQRTAIQASASADPAAEFIASEQQQSAPTPTLAPTPPKEAPKAQGCRCAMGGGNEGAPEIMLAAAAAASAYLIRHRRQKAR